MGEVRKGRGERGEFARSKYQLGDPKVGQVGWVLLGWWVRHLGFNLLPRIFRIPYLPQIYSISPLSHPSSASPLRAKKFGAMLVCAKVSRFPQGFPRPRGREPVVVEDNADKIDLIFSNSSVFPSQLLGNLVDVPVTCYTCIQVPRE